MHWIGNLGRGAEPLLFAEQLGGVDGKRAAGGNPCGDEAYKRHGDDSAEENQRIARRGLINEEREQAAGEDTQEQADA